MCVENNVQKRCRGGKPVYILENIEATRCNISLAIGFYAL